jgi:hypothetical protein
MKKLFLRCACCGQSWNVSRLRSPSLVYVCPDCEARQHAHLKADRRLPVQITSARCGGCARTERLEF